MIKRAGRFPWVGVRVAGNPAELDGEVKQRLPSLDRSADCGARLLSPLGRAFFQGPLAHAVGIRGDQLANKLVLAKVADEHAGVLLVVGHAADDLAGHHRLLTFKGGVEGRVRESKSAKNARFALPSITNPFLDSHRNGRFRRETRVGDTGLEPVTSAV